jgi:hypothetical protein
MFLNILVEYINHFTTCVLHSFKFRMVYLSVTNLTHTQITGISAPAAGVERQDVHTAVKSYHCMYLVL